MNDIEFAHRVSPQIGVLYREAKRSRHPFPKNALILMRSLVNLCCNALAQPVDAWWSNASLSEKIEWLAQTHRINFDTRELLHQLRRWGNAAAHPENSLCSDDEFTDMASKALGIALKLLEMTFRVQQMGAALPAFVVIEEKPYELQELCYRAIIAGSAAEQYQVAIALLLEREARIKQAGADADAGVSDRAGQPELNGIKTRALDLLGYASNAGYPPAQYEFALALLNGVHGSGKTSLALELIAMAAEEGLADALAWRGQSALYGHHGCEVDYEAARGFMEKAAADDHPGALTLLSRMYRNGLGVPKNASAAFALTMKAAEAGFPAAQFEVALALRDGDGVPKDDYAALAWLRKSSDAGYADAQCLLARVIQHGLARPIKRSIRASVAHSSIRKVGRNEQCPCGSREKYKRCCA